MEEKVRVLNTTIEDKDWMAVNAEIPCDILMTILERYMNLSGKVVHLDLPDRKKAVILCIEKGTLVEICDKVSRITDEAFVDMFQEVFCLEDEVLERKELINFLTKVTSGTDPVVLVFNM